MQNVSLFFLLFFYACNRISHVGEEASEQQLSSLARSPNLPQITIGLFIAIFASV